MTEKLSCEERLFEQAFDLIIRLQDDPANVVARDLALQWRAHGPEYEAAWAEASEIYGIAGQVLRDRRDTHAPSGRISRRGLMLGGVAGVLTLGSGALFGPGMLLRAQADQITSTAELRRVELPDGSSVTLGPDSAMRSQFGDDARQVDLLAGMGFFDIASDAGRPFTARLAGLSARLSGAAFELSKDAGLVSVAVAHGTVEVSTGPGADGAMLADGEWLSLASGASVVRGKREAGQVGAWRDGMIVADNEPVAAVIARIARWQPGRVLVASSELGARPISGVFDLGNPFAALEAVVQPHGGRVRRLSSWLTVISPV